ncbi:MAG: Methyltransferase type 11 [Phycisphaerales bacterium]|jgi:ubiquinone/menaquinone biosynthesis C-methylase UbiE|nr:Methyltransferase type 11 [Phycisphaerales bacterium]
MPHIRRFGPAILPGLVLSLLVGIVCRAEDRAAPPTPAARSAEASVYSTTQPSSDGIGKVYMGREIAQVMGHLAAGWLERPDREREEQPTKAIELMGLKESDVVADIGAGTGYFSFRIAKKVTKGKVLAVDIQKQMLEIMTRIAKREGVTNVEPVLGTIEDPNLPEAGVDVALMVDAYHEFDHPREMMVAIVKALKPGGRVIDIEYRGEDPDVPIKPHHKMTEAQAIKEMTAVGLRHVKTFNDLPQQHLMIFEKPSTKDTNGDTKSHEEIQEKKS